MRTRLLALTATLALTALAAPAPRVEANAYCSPSFCALMKRSESEILGKTDFDFFPPELAEKYRLNDLVR